jgi:selenocysteine lyase/cysteine desulfurase
VVNLNNAGVCPTPRGVLDVLKSAWDASNPLPAHALLRVQEKKVEDVRRALAAFLACDPESLAITRNASESMATFALGRPLAAGDEVVVTDHNYPRVLQTWAQRARRDGIVVKTVSPTSDASDDALFDLVFSAVGPKTKVLEICHVTNVLGRVWPVARIVAEARRRGIDVLVDGAHGLHHVPTRISDLGATHYAASLHKWVGAPVGTGLLVLARERIRDHFALMPPPASLQGDIRKFEETGTRPAAPRLAILEALRWQEAIGLDRKRARLAFLRKRIVDRLRGRSEAVVLGAEGDAQAPGITYIALPGRDPRVVTSRLFERHGILVVGVPAWREPGIRVSPNVYTRTQDVDRFSDAFESVLKETS